MPAKVKRIVKKVKSKKHRRNKKISRGLSIKGPMKAFSASNPFPRTWICKLRYTDSQDLTTGTSGVFGASYSWGLNTLYDPYLGSGGHQPYGYDQFKALYNRYIVTGCLVEITLNNPSDDGLVFGALVQSSTGVGSLVAQTPAIITEQPYAWTCPINNTGSQVKKFKQYFPMHTVEGLDRIQYHCNLTGYASVIGANPTNVPDIEIAVASDKAEAGDTLTARITLTYFTKFYDPILQAGS